MSTPSADIHKLREELQNAPEESPHGRIDGDDTHAAGDHRFTSRREKTAADPSDGGDRGKERGRRRGEIFPECPVLALGVFGDTNFYLDVRGQLRAVVKHDLDKIRHLFGGRTALLAQHFPQFDKHGDPVPAYKGRFDQAKAATAMVAACDEKGVWEPTGSVRGTGCWTDEDGNLIYHAGDEILIGGDWLPPGQHRKKVYSAASPTPRGEPIPRQAQSDPFQDLHTLVSSWNWRRPDVDPQLAIGSMGAQMMGGALDWRPVTWLTGDQATGKSEFQKLLAAIHGGEAGLKQATDATEAGIRSVVGFSSLPVAIDEFEPDPDNPRKTKSVIELARRAASGGQIFRGSSDQKGYQSNAYSCFLFSSILVPPMPSQDRSRLILLDLDRLPDGAAKPNLAPARLREIGARIRQRLFDGWPIWSERLELWRAGLARHGQHGRAADNYATVLAMADAASSLDLPSAEVVENWCSRMGSVIANDSIEVGSNAEDMLTWLFTQNYDPFRRGEQYTVSQWIMAAARLAGAPAGLYDSKHTAADQEEAARKANYQLGKIGLRVRDRAEKASIFFPNKPFSGLTRLFEGSQWADGAWSQAAARLPGAERASCTLVGTASRGHYVPITSIPGLMSFPADRTQEGERAGAYPDDASDFY